MTLPNFPNNPSIGETWPVGDTTYKCVAVATPTSSAIWRIVSPADKGFRSELADVASTVSIAGTPARDLASKTDLTQTYVDMENLLEEHKVGVGAHPYLLVSAELAAPNSATTVAGILARDLSSKQNVVQQLTEHDASPTAHAALTSLVTAEANRAEAAAQAALTNGKIYPTSTAGQSDGALAVDAYFWVIAAADTSVIELWRKGSSVPTDTGKRMVDYNYVKDSGTEGLVGDIKFAVVGDDNSRTWLEVDAYGNPTSLAAEKINDIVDTISSMPFPDANTQAFAIVGDNGSRTWLEIDDQGKPTEHSVEILLEVIAPAKLENIPSPIFNKQAFAIVGENDTQCWLETDPSGKPTDYAVECIREKLGSLGVDASYYMDSTGVKRRVSSGPDIVAWGDSMTIGATGVPYTDYLRTMLMNDGKTNQVFNLGVGGESSMTITARANGTPFTALVTGGVIPASGRVAITLLPINGATVEPIRQSGNWAVTMAGLTGIFGADNNNGVYSYWFERSVAGDPIPSTRPEAIYLEAGEQRRGDIAIIWIGTNRPKWVDNNNSDATRNNERAINDAKAIIRQLTALDKRYLVISKPDGGSEKDVEDARFFDEFDQRFIPIRQYLTTPIYAGDGTTIISCYGIQDAGFTATPQDLVEISERRIPQSLRNDGVHWKAEVYEVLAKVIYKKLTQLGWI